MPVAPARLCSATGVHCGLGLALCKVVVEECVRRGLPVIAVDPQGDLASLALCGDPNTLEEMGVDPKIAAEYWSRVDVKIWTPGSTYGIPLSLAPSFQTANIERYEDKVAAWGGIAAALAALGGFKDEGSQVAFSMILEYADEYGLLIENLNDFIAFLVDPPVPLTERLDPIYDEKSRAKAARAFQIKMKGHNRLLFDLGRAIDIDRLYGYEPGGAVDHDKVRLSVIYLNTLNTQEDKEIFVAGLTQAMYQWMLREPSEEPVGLFYIDEVAPYLPPVRKPASKHGLMMLLRQARKYGVCCLLATQSPGDIDYKALAQTGTWALGKLATEQEKAKVANALRSDAEVDAREIIDSLGSAGRGRFYLINSDHFEAPVETQVRWLVTEHKTLNVGAVESIVSDDDREIHG